MNPVCWLIPFFCWPNTSIPPSPRIELLSELLQLPAAFFSAQIQSRPFLKGLSLIWPGGAPSRQSVWVRLNMILFIGPEWRQSCHCTELRDGNVQCSLGRYTQLHICTTTQQKRQIFSLLSPAANRVFFRYRPQIKQFGCWSHCMNDPKTGSTVNDTLQVCVYWALEEKLCPCGGQ